MSKIQVDKRNNYTVMQNDVLRNQKLSLRAKGLFTVMWSLPEEWDFTVRGLTNILKEGKDAINSALKELEREGFLERIVTREKGKFSSIDYRLHEVALPIAEKSDTVKPIAEKPPQNNIKRKTKKKEKNVNENGFSEKNDSLESLSSDNLKDRIFKICLGIHPDQGQQLTDNCYRIIRMYFDKFLQCRGENHPRLGDKTLKRIIEALVDGVEYGNEFLSCDDIDCYSAIIDTHFNTNYSRPIDYHISHFMTDGIRLNRLWEIIRNCESQNDSKVF